MPFNVIGLISGGKDSLYSLAHCIQNGHKIVALANLYPEQSRSGTIIEIADRSDGMLSEKDQTEGADLNSFMYQTVGHSVIPLYSEALGIPLYRRAITGTAEQTSINYQPGTSTDETEDMFLLLQDALGAHPEVNAVCAGAILSTYQRTRVESVASRLNLTPLTYLWQYPFLPPPTSRSDLITALLDDMALVGCDARIIKIASGGIRSNALFANVVDPATRMKLVSGLARFYSEGRDGEAELRAAVLGEGGEYETLALDGPPTLWKKKLDIEMADSFEAEGGTLYARFGKAVVVDKAIASSTNAQEIPIPTLLDKRFATILSRLRQQQEDTLVSPPTTNPMTRATTTTTTTTNPFSNPKMHISKSRTSLHITNLTDFNHTSPSTPTSAAHQLQRILTVHLPTLLDDPNLLQTLSHVTLLLRDMSDFATANSTYTTYLWPPNLPNPPARVTIAAPLPTGIEVSLNLTSDLIQLPLTSHGPPIRKGLHVQSLSYWAPANIGPYSQAISSPLFLPSTRPLNTETIELIHVAGQIPLTPANMTLHTGPFFEQAVLALQHLWRLGQERRVDWWIGAGVAYLARGTGSGESDEEVSRNARCAARAWKGAWEVDERGLWRGKNTLENGAVYDDGDTRSDDGQHEDDADVWDLQRNRGFSHSHTGGASNMTVGEHLHVLPNHNVFSNHKKSGQAELGPISPPFIAAQVSGLPRDAPIEWWSTGLAGLVHATGAKCCRVPCADLGLYNWGSLRGVVVEQLVGEEGVDSEDEDGRAAGRSRVAARSGQVCDRLSMSWFVTLCLKKDLLVNAMLPRSLDDIKSLFVLHNVSQENKPEPIVCELVSAHALINLNSANIGQLMEESELLKSSATVPCHHVWASEPRNETRNTAPAGDAAIEDEEDLVEVAAAIMLRIDGHAS